ncbi:MAG: hypothetical protein AB1546_03460 [bacterium]
MRKTVFRLLGNMVDGRSKTIFVISHLPSPVSHHWLLATGCWLLSALYFLFSTSFLFAADQPVSEKPLTINEITQEVNKVYSPVHSYQVSFTLFQNTTTKKIDEGKVGLKTEKYVMWFKEGNPRKTNGDYIRLKGLKGRNQGTEVFFTPQGNKTRITVMRGEKRVTVPQDDPRIRDLFRADLHHYVSRLKEMAKDENVKKEIKAIGGEYHLIFNFKRQMEKKKAGIVVKFFQALGFVKEPTGKELEKMIRITAVLDTETFHFLRWEEEEKTIRMKDFVLTSRQEWSDFKANEKFPAGFFRH